MTWLPRSPGLTLVLGTLPRWLSGPSNQAYLSSPHLEASPVTTFRTCFSLAPTPVMSQPAPAILSRESVHIMLSITHHTRKRPSTGPRTTHGPQERAGEGAAKCARGLPHVCEHKCLATTKRGRGIGECVVDLISDSSNDHDNGEACFS
jgi:hypothetical protein